MISKELPYGQPLHDKIRRMVRERRLMSYNKMRNFHSKWDEADDSFRAYQPSTAEMDARKGKRRQGIHDFTTITVPYTYAITMTAHTYWSTVFLSRSPVYQLQGRHGESQDSVEAFEAALDYQLTTGQHLVPHFNQLFDMSKYGLGVVGGYWERQEATISQIVEKPLTIGRIPILGKTKKVVQTANVLKYEGNCLYNVRLYDFFPDPRVALTYFQKGEFCGRDTQVGWHEILDGQRQGRYFNVEVLARKLSDSSAYETFEQGSQRVELPDLAGESVEGRVPGPGFVRLHEMTIRIIPKLLGLSPSDRTEKWVFTLANNEVIIGARPQGALHDMFPFALMEHGVGAHEFMKIGPTEILQPIVDTISWLFNSHFYNVRKALNDVRVVDPSRVVMKDLTSPIERGIVRLTPEAYGTDVRTVVHQLDVKDMTARHLTDAGLLELMLQRISGVVDELMGLSAGPSRESATGVRTRTGFAANRLKTVAEYNSALGMQPLMQMLISNTQQYMETEQKFRIAGPGALARAQSFLQVNPELIAGSYDYVPVDGTLPVDRLAQANFFKELAVQIAQAPNIAPAWNINEMITYIMRLQGIKNIERFRIDLSNPQEVADQVQRGNLIPIDGGRGGGAASTNRGSSGATL